MSDNNQYPKPIFKAELVKRDGKVCVSFTRHSNHIPTLDHVVNQLQYDIIELRAMEKTKKEMEKSKILKANGMVNLIRRGMN